MINDNETVTLYSRTHKIVKSNEHKDMFIFSALHGTGFFTISSSLSWIRENMEVKTHPFKPQKMLLRRKRAVA